MKFNISLFRDILKESGKDGVKKYSQARVYTFLSVISYFTIHSFMTIGAFRPIVAESHMNIEVLTLVSTGLYNAMLLFCGYTFGGKFIDVIDKIRGTKNETSE